MFSGISYTQNPPTSKLEKNEQQKPPNPCPCRLVAQVLRCQSSQLEPIPYTQTWLQSAQPTLDSRHPPWNHHTDLPTRHVVLFPQ